MSINMKIESKDNSLFGSDTYRDKTILVPRAYQPTINMTVNLNKPGTNANVTVRSDDYVVANVEGRQIATDRFIMTTKFNSLQSVVALEERSRIYDSHIAFLTRAKPYFMDGALPDLPLVMKALPGTLYT